VRLDLTSATVMQSLLVPRLAGQIYAMAGMRTQLNLEADQPGRFFGENTQFNGTGFQNQKFGVDAMDEAGFARWLAEVRAQPNRLDATEYERLTRRTTLPHPITYAAVQPDLFGRVVSLRQPSGHTLEFEKLPARPLPVAIHRGMPHDHGNAQ
jgi:cytochrome o ubiquinol oxidase subunit II